MTFCSILASLLYQFEQELDTDEKEIMVFLCSDLMSDVSTPEVPGDWKSSRGSQFGQAPSDVVKIQSFLAIITDLEKLDLISPMHLDLIENCFLTIHRRDLAKKIQKYKLEEILAFQKIFLHG
ncbi:CASP8 and FADD-like apoptosis regulator [Crotalus adamanteus]|uniref:CASP8 and FADD-like apoptosis regulator n=1 Tax=Crotalus adamanteus TaxID=8729 RepID=A0AAW1CAR5_CROAD